VLTGGFFPLVFPASFSLLWFYVFALVCLFIRAGVNSGTKQPPELINLLGCGGITSSGI
jgi:hypothetical protein